MHAVKHVLASVHVTLQPMSRTEVLVVDTSGFIKCTSLESVGKEIVTVRDVISEVKDLQTRQRLSVLPFDLKFRDPDPKAIRCVSEFAKKTGDFASLSAVDLRLLALCRQLVVEHSSDHGASLRTEPSTQAECTSFNRVGSTCTAGFYYGPKTEENINTHSGTQDPDSESVENGKASLADNPQIATEGLLASFETEDKQEEQITKLLKSDSSEPSRENSTSMGDETMDIGEKILTEESEERDEDEQEEEDDGGQWITPQNIDKIKVNHGLLNMAAVCKEIKVACMTTDFAMQNVLLQMGIPVISVDGQLVRQIRTYVLRCFSCMKITRDTMRRFCPICGNDTLLRLPVSVDDSGRMYYHLAKNKRITTRGTKYSLPLPKGGRSSDVHILKEDQAVTWKPPRTRKMPVVDALDPDFLARSSPFAAHDVSSRGAQIYFARGGRGGRMKNPNESRKKTGKRKK